MSKEKEKNKQVLKDMLQKATEYAQEHDLQVITFCVRPDDDDQIYASHYSSIEFEASAIEALKSDLINSIMENKSDKAEA